MVMAISRSATASFLYPNSGNLLAFLRALNDDCHKPTLVSDANLSGGHGSLLSLCPNGYLCGRSLVVILGPVEFPFCFL